MTAKEYLRQYENLMRRYKNLCVELADAEIEADTIRSTSDNDGMPHGSNIGHPTEEKAIRIADLRRTLTSIRDDAKIARLEIDTVIAKVDGIEQIVLYLKYVKLMRWEDISKEISYSYRQTHRLHASGLKQVDKLLSQDGTQWHTHK